MSGLSTIDGSEITVYTIEDDGRKASNDFSINVGGFGAATALSFPKYKCREKLQVVVEGRTETLRHTMTLMMMKMKGEY